LKFDSAWRKPQVSFSSDGVSISVEHHSSLMWWHISPASHINQTTPSIPNNDDTKSCLICYACPDSQTKTQTKHGDGFCSHCRKTVNSESAKAILTSVTRSMNGSETNGAGGMYAANTRMDPSNPTIATRMVNGCWINVAGVYSGYP
jgi:hypothetical protein